MEETNIASFVDMEATAQLEAVKVRPVANLDGADYITILFAKEGHCPGGNSLLLGHMFDVNRPVCQDGLVNGRLDFSQLLFTDPLPMSKVKAQPVGGDQGTFLEDVCA